MSSITDFGPRELSKWRSESARATNILKKANIRLLPDPVVAGFFFNDATVTVSLTHAEISGKTAPELANHLYDLVLSIAKSATP